MPFGDGTGRLGRGRNCDEVAISDRAGGGFGRGRGLGRGFGRGAGRGFRRFAYADPYFEPYYREPTKVEEKSYLQSDLKSLEAEIKAVKKRLEELK